MIINLTLPNFVARELETFEESLDNIFPFAVIGMLKAPCVVCPPMAKAALPVGAANRIFDSSGLVAGCLLK